MKKIVLNETDLVELNNLICELPHKYAVVLIDFFNKRYPKDDSESVVT